MDDTALGFTDAEIEMMADVAMKHAIRVFNAEAKPAAVVREMLAAVDRERKASC